MIIDVVRRALDSGATYADEVIAFAEIILRPGPEHLVEAPGGAGTAFGRDVAGALHYIRGTSATPMCAASAPTNSGIAHAQHQLRRDTIISDLS